MAAIETRSLSKRYGSLHAVRDLDLRVERGEVFGLLGPNGAGKSTTIDVLLDFVRPTAGSVTVLGHDPQAAPRAVRERTGTLPEAYGFYDRSSARDHLRFAVRMRGAEDDPDRLLARVGLDGTDADRPVGGFSKGMRQRLGLAVALVGDPDLLILDEPLGGLDPAGARLFRRIVREERDRGAAVLLSSHITTQVEVLCDRVGVMHDGRLVAVDTVAGLRGATDARDALLVGLNPSGVPDSGATEAREATRTTAERVLASTEGVREVTREGTTLRVECVEPGAKAAAIARLDEADVPIRDVDVAAASLEDLFLDLVDDGNGGTTRPAGADGGGGDGRIAEDEDGLGDDDGGEGGRRPNDRDREGSTRPSAGADR
jgi:ABC-2 type transport system ATP-binding protein